MHTLVADERVEADLNRMREEINVYEIDFFAFGSIIRDSLTETELRRDAF